MDKLEERDEELSRLRQKCIAAIQCLAHIREKCAEVQMDIKEQAGLLEEAQMEAFECRERVNYYKQARDTMRLEIEKLKEDSGLLTKSRLLSDMETSLQEREQIKIELELLENVYEKNKKMIDNLKQYAEKIQERIKLHHPTIPLGGARKYTTSGLKTKKIYKDPIEYSHVHF